MSTRPCGFWGDNLIHPVKESTGQSGLSVGGHWSPLGGGCLVCGVSRALGGWVALVPSRGHQSTGALPTAEGQDQCGWRCHTLNVAFLQRVSSRWLEAVQAEWGQSWSWTLPTALAGRPLKWKASGQRSRGMGPAGATWARGPSGRGGTQGVEVVKPLLPGLSLGDPHSPLVPALWPGCWAPPAHPMPSRV